MLVQWPVVLFAFHEKRNNLCIHCVDSRSGNMLFLFIIISVLIETNHAQQCVDNQNKPVDWYALYKVPRIKDHLNENISKGIAYLYITSETVENGWALANDTIVDADSFPGRTLSVIIGNDVNDIFWIFYNDQPPHENFTLKDGHTKGVVVGSQDGGFWLVHSVPKFPVIDRSQGYVYPPTGTKYGQSFLCISLKKENLDNVGYQLMINDAHVFEKTFQGGLKNVYPMLKRAADMERVKVVKSKEIIVSVNKAQFVSFAKSPLFNKDLYSQWVAEALECSLYVETWLHDDRLPSDCNDTYQVNNVNQITSQFFQFKNFQDHSKWSVTNCATKPWVCIGDINRAKTQFIRGGGTVCFEHSFLWRIYHDLISAIEECPKEIGSVEV